MMRIREVIEVAAVVETHKEERDANSSPSNVRSLEKPKNRNGQQLCLRFHTLGYCFEDCGYKNGHGQLDSNETSSVKAFVEAARASKSTFRSRRGTMRGSTDRVSNNTNEDNIGANNNTSNEEGDTGTGPQ